MSNNTDERQAFEKNLDDNTIMGVIIENRKDYFPRITFGVYDEISRIESQFTINANNLWNEGGEKDIFSTIDTLIELLQKAKSFKAVNEL